MQGLEWTLEIALRCPSSGVVIARYSHPDFEASSSTTTMSFLPSPSPLSLPDVSTSTTTLKYWYNIRYHSFGWSTSSKTMGYEYEVEVSLGFVIWSIRCNYTRIYSKIMNSWYSTGYVSRINPLTHCWLLSCLEVSVRRGWTVAGLLGMFLIS